MRHLRLLFFPYLYSWSQDEIFLCLHSQRLTAEEDLSEPWAAPLVFSMGSVLPELAVAFSRHTNPTAVMLDAPLSASDNWPRSYDDAWIMWLVGVRRSCLQCLKSYMLFMLQCLDFWCNNLLLGVDVIVRPTWLSLVYWHPWSFLMRHGHSYTGLSVPSDVYWASSTFLYHEGPLCPVRGTTWSLWWCVVPSVKPRLVSGHYLFRLFSKALFFFCQSFISSAACYL